MRADLLSVGYPSHALWLLGQYLVQVSAGRPSGLLQSTTRPRPPAVVRRAGNKGASGGGPGNA